MRIIPTEALAVGEAPPLTEVTAPINAATGSENPIYAGWDLVAIGSDVATTMAGNLSGSVEYTATTSRMVVIFHSTESYDVYINRVALGK